MPDNSPPKWMFRNIAAVRRNTDRFLDVLERNTHPPDGSALPATEVMPDHSRRCAPAPIG